MELFFQISIMVFYHQDLLKNVFKLQEKKGIFISADSQSSSQIGDIGRFKNVNLITPTEREARLSIKNHEDDAYYSFR